MVLFQYIIPKHRIFPESRKFFLASTEALKLYGEATLIVYDKYLYFNPLNTKSRLLYLKTQFVPRSKHFSSRL